MGTSCLFANELQDIYYVNRNNHVPEKWLLICISGHSCVNKIIIFVDFTCTEKFDRLDLRFSSSVTANMHVICFDVCVWENLASFHRYQWPTMQMTYVLSLRIMCFVKQVQRRLYACGFGHQIELRVDTEVSACVRCWGKVWEINDTECQLLLH